MGKYVGPSATDTVFPFWF